MKNEFDASSGVFTLIYELDLSLSNVETIIYLSPFHFDAEISSFEVQISPSNVVTFSKTDEDLHGPSRYVLKPTPQASDLQHVTLHIRNVPTLATM